MRNIIFIFILSLSLQLGFSQETVDCQNPKFAKTIDRYLSESVDLISVNEFYQAKQKYIILDAREVNEYEVSHIEGAEYIGFNDPTFDMLKDVDKNTPLVVYCSIGYRSEKIGEQLQEMGFTEVKNLYGSIFEWVNNGYPIVDKQGNKTQELHTYNKSWGKWVENSEIKKVNK